MRLVLVTMAVALVSSYAVYGTTADDYSHDQDLHISGRLNAAESLRKKRFADNDDVTAELDELNEYLTFAAMEELQEEEENRRSVNGNNIYPQRLPPAEVHPRSILDKMKFWKKRKTMKRTKPPRRGRFEYQTRPMGIASKKGTAKHPDHIFKRLPLSESPVSKRGGWFRKVIDKGRDFCAKHPTICAALVKVAGGKKR